MLMSEKELANLISEHLPMNIEESENFVHAISNGYTWGNIDYAMAMSSRDNLILQLNKRNETLQAVALNAYIGWVKGDDVITPMIRLRKELESQGFNIEAYLKSYDEKGK